LVCKQSSTKIIVLFLNPDEIALEALGYLANSFDLIPLVANYYLLYIASNSLQTYLAVSVPDNNVLTAKERELL
jgi:hypothetical protein